MKTQARRPRVGFPRLHVAPNSQKLFPMALKSKGKPAAPVYLVGAGPGDPGLLTLRGAELLSRADVVVYDALVNADLLRLAPKSAEIIYGGKRAREQAIPQEELNQLLIAKARAGWLV